MKTAENDIIIRDLKQSKIGMKRRDDKTATNLCLHGRYVGVCLCTKVHKIKNFGPRRHYYLFFASSLEVVWELFGRSDWPGL